MDVKVNSTSVTPGRAFFQTANHSDDLSWLLGISMSLLPTLPLKRACLKKDDLGLKSIKSGAKQFFRMFGPGQIGQLALEPFLLTKVSCRPCKPRKSSVDIHGRGCG
jgi:hypothetical protein